MSLIQRKTRLVLSSCFQEMIAAQEPPPPPSPFPFLHPPPLLPCDTFNPPLICASACFLRKKKKKKLRAPLGPSFFFFFFRDSGGQAEGFALYGPAVASTHKLGPHHLGAPRPGCPPPVRHYLFHCARSPGLRPPPQTRKQMPRR